MRPESGSSGRPCRAYALVASFAPSVTIALQRLRWSGPPNAAEILDQLEAFLNGHEPASGLAALLRPIAPRFPPLSSMAGRGALPVT